MNINDVKGSPNLWKSYLEWVSLHPDIALELEMFGGKNSYKKTFLEEKKK